jgi:hypothetical protein
MSKIRFVGLDFHADTIAVAVAESDGLGPLGIIPNRLNSICKLVAKLGPLSNSKSVVGAGRWHVSWFDSQLARRIARSP